MSFPPLSDASVTILRGHRPLAPTFSNQIMAEKFDAKHTRGRFKVLVGSDGKYVAFETGLLNGQGGRARFATDREASLQVEFLAAVAETGTSPTTPASATVA